MVEDTAFVHQIFIADGFGLPDRLPDVFQRTTQAVRALYPDAAYRLWDGCALQAFLSDHFEPEVRQAFDRLRPYAYKADLARYCLLFHFGGLYVDLGNLMLKRLDPPAGTGLASFRDLDFGSPCWTAVNNGLIWAKPGRPEMRLAIDMIIDNGRTHFYGANWLYPTGPALFGRAMIAVKAERGQSPDADDQWVGTCRPIRLKGGVGSLRFVSPDGAGVARRIKTEGADLTHLGAVGTNNYATIWRSRSVYGERIRRWRFDDVQIRFGSGVRRTATGIVSARSTEEPALRIVLGPIEAGSYRFAVVFARSVALPWIRQDVVGADGNVVAFLAHEAAGDQRAGAAMDFEVDDQRPIRELHVHLGPAPDAEITEVILEPLDRAAAPA